MKQQHKKQKQKEVNEMENQNQDSNTQTKEETVIGYYNRRSEERMLLKRYVRTLSNRVLNFLDGHNSVKTVERAVVIESIVDRYIPHLHIGLMPLVQQVMPKSQTTIANVTHTENAMEIIKAQVETFLNGQ